MKSNASYLAAGVAVGLVVSDIITKGEVHRTVISGAADLIDNFRGKKEEPNIVVNGDIEV